MTSASPAPIGRIQSADPLNAADLVTLPRWRSLPAPTLALTAVFLAFVFCPRVSGNPRLAWTFAAVAAALLLWQAILWFVAKGREQSLRIEYVAVKAHYVQAIVQGSIMIYWGWHAPNVVHEAPLIVAQLVFFYIFEALITWSRGRAWRLGFGPVPIILSTNLLLWFKDDWFACQFLMLAIGALAKQYITWIREGRRAHIFNPSAFGQFLFAIVLISTATTNELTFGREIASTFEVPHMLIVIFLGGLVVQYIFHVTLMTLSAVCVLCMVNIAYTKATGTYFFVNINIAAPIFLGVHLLITDPATSPRTNLGQVVFGALYGLGYCVLFRVLDLNEVPTFWDKLLPVPILNLAVPLIDRIARSGMFGSINNRWETALPPSTMNLAHMALWIALFGTMLGTGFIEAPHPGNSIPFWKKAYEEGKPFAGHNLVMATGAQAVGGGSGAAYNELGLFCMQGSIPGVNQSNSAAAKYFAEACALNDRAGCTNVTIQRLFLQEWISDEVVSHAMELLEKDCEVGGDSLSCYLVGFAHETGRGRPLNKQRAVELYERAGGGDLYAQKGLARIALSSSDLLYDSRQVIPRLAYAAEQGDAESMYYLAWMYHDGLGLRQDLLKAMTLMKHACDLGSTKACEVLQQPVWPAYSNPVMLVPGWSTAFPDQ